MIIKKYYKLVRVSHEDSEYFYIKNVSNEAGLFSVTSNDGYHSLAYSTDGINWTNYSGDSVTVESNTNIYLKGTFSHSRYSDYTTLSFDKTFIIGGNIASLITTSFKTVTSISAYYGLSKLFYGQTNLTDASRVNIGLVSTISGESIFGSLFAGCTSLIEPPDFSTITTLSASNIFSNMFNGCTSLSSVMRLGNITNINSNFVFNETYNGCISLTEGMNLTFTTVGSGATAPFQNTYFGCSKLEKVWAPNCSVWNTSQFSNWLVNAGTSATGTKIVNAPTGLSIPIDSGSGIPTGWTRVDY